MTNTLSGFYNNINLILKYGFKLHSDTTEGDCIRIAKKINLLLNTGHSPYVGHIDPDGKTIHIETTYFDPVLSVDVSEGAIFFIPLVDSNWHGAFFEVLKILFLWQKNVIKKEDEERKKRKEEIPDFEWI